MRTLARPSESEPEPPHPTGRHAKSGQQPESDFDYSQPFDVDVGRAAVIAEALRECGFAGCTADVVLAELAMPDRWRSMIGRFAADQLARAGWRP